MENPSHTPSRPGADERAQVNEMQQSEPGTGAASQGKNTGEGDALPTDPKGILDQIDIEWWTKQNPRKLDLVGDYAGQELFIIDGDALVQYILDDPLLAIAKPSPPALLYPSTSSSSASSSAAATSSASKKAEKKRQSTDDIFPQFAYAHAVWKLEKVVVDLVERDAVFDVVFFECNKINTIRPTSSTDTQSRFATASRALAREMLKRHLINHMSREAFYGRDEDEAEAESRPGGEEGWEGLRIWEFEGLEDEGWKKYNDEKRPMFYMGTDAGLPQTSEPEESKRILLQRKFLYDVMKQEIAFVPLPSTVFKDTKILSYVYDKIRGHSRRVISPAILAAISTYRSDLQALLPTAGGPDSPRPPPNEGVLEWLARSAAFAHDKQYSGLVLVFIAHVLLLPELRIEQRAQSLIRGLEPGFVDFITGTFSTVFEGIVEVAKSDAGSAEVVHLAVDLTVFGWLLLRLLSGEVSAEALKAQVGEVVFEAVSAFPRMDLSRCLEGLADLKSAYNIELQAIEDTSSAERGQGDDGTQATLLPYSEPTFNRLLGGIEVNTSSADTSATVQSHLDNDTVFSDTRHWHNTKPILAVHQGGEKVDRKGLTAWQIAKAARKKERQNQRFMASMQRSAASLTGAASAALQQQVIPLVGNRTSNLPASTPSSREVSVQNAKSKKEKPLSKAEKMKADIAAAKSAQVGDEESVWWADQLNAIEKNQNLGEQAMQLEKLMAGKRIASSRTLLPEATIKRLDIELRRWIADDNRKKSFVADNNRTYLARHASELYQKAVAGKVDLSGAHQKKLGEMMDALGLAVMIPELAATDEAPMTSKKDAKKDKVAKGKEKEKEKGKKEEKEKLSFSFTSLKSKSTGEWRYSFMAVKEDPWEWQLRCMGDYMIRSLDSRPDRRVLFEPDAWQIDVLDKIDRDESMLVIAPTSSGKTFISFAAMERVLRGSDTGIAIYVAPTKALVNQVAAEVYARFRKSLPGASLWSIHTRDYRINNPHNCQILVTVPEILSIMLLSPSLASVWIPRIRYIIVDEIHSITQDEGGAVWETCLLMNPAPLIGLSATVGSPERFSDWLQSVESVRGKKFSLVYHQHRFNALRKFVYAPTFPPPAFAGLLSYAPTQERLVKVHPISALALGFQDPPEDLALEAHDCLELYNEMKKAAGPNSRDLDGLIPAEFLADASKKQPQSPATRTAQVIAYEAQLKAVLKRWKDRPNSHEPGSPYMVTVRALEAPLRERTAQPERQMLEAGKQGFYDSMLPLMLDLHAKSALPAIIFNFDRQVCEDIANRLVADLDKAEQHYKETSPAWKVRLAKAEQEKKAFEAKKKALEAAEKRKKTKRNDEDGGDDVAESLEGPTFDEDAPLEEYSFFGKGASLLEIEEDIDSFQWSGKVPQWAQDALRRGIGCHHAGMNRAYRAVVETLFRKGYLRVIISTGTLALGINAPAKTTVFAGDSVFLTALNFRQCAGRAGRRGHDLRGDVVFYALPLVRVQRLLLSRLPRLGGNFPLTTTMIMRLHNLLHGSESANVSVNSVNAMLSLPQLTVNSKTGQAQILHFTRFSIEYLRRSALLDEHGRPLNLFAIASNLYQYEPANFALVALLRSGRLHALTRDYDNPNLRPAIQRQLVLILSHLFARVPRRKQSPESLEAVIKREPGMIVLSALPGDVKAVLEEHHRSILTIFGSYAKEFVLGNERLLGDESKLPYSGVSVGQPASKSTATTTSSLSTYLTSTSIPNLTRSPHPSTSSLPPHFRSIPELSSTARSGIHLNANAVPSLSGFIKEEGDGAEVLDAYAVDFFTHGQMESLVRGNGIRRGDVWFKLQDFDLALATIKSALEVLLKRSPISSTHDPESAPAEEGDDTAFTHDPEGQDFSENEDNHPGTANGSGEGGDRLAQKPKGVGEDDWRLYRCFVGVSEEFGRKFRATFA